MSLIIFFTSCTTLRGGLLGITNSEAVKLTRNGEKVNFISAEVAKKCELKGQIKADKPKPIFWSKTGVDPEADAVEALNKDLRNRASLIGANSISNVILSKPSIWNGTTAARADAFICNQSAR